MWGAVVPTVAASDAAAAVVAALTRDGGRAAVRALPPLWGDTRLARGGRGQAAPAAHCILVRKSGNDSTCTNGFRAARIRVRSLLYPQSVEQRNVGATATDRETPSSVIAILHKTLSQAGWHRRVVAQQRNEADTGVEGAVDSHGKQLSGETRQGGGTNKTKHIAVLATSGGAQAKKKKIEEQ